MPLGRPGLFPRSGFSFGWRGGSDALTTNHTHLLLSKFPELCYGLVPPLSSTTEWQ